MIRWIALIAVMFAPNAVFGMKAWGNSRQAVVQGVEYLLAVVRMQVAFPRIEGIAEFIMGVAQYFFHAK